MESQQVRGHLENLRRLLGEVPQLKSHITKGDRPRLSGDLDAAYFRPWYASALNSIAIVAGRDSEYVENFRRYVGGGSSSDYLNRGIEFINMVLKDEALLTTVHVEEKAPYIDFTRIRTLAQISRDFDTSKLIQICEDINKAWSIEAFAAVAALIRMLMDHVPPIFGKESFLEVTNNVQWSKSTCKILKNLGQTRDFSDLALHMMISRKSLLVMQADVEGQRSAVNQLIQEVVNRLKP